MRIVGERIQHIVNKSGTDADFIQAVQFGGLDFFPIVLF
jgi:hypothetical protein